jgi:addiction module HigA family antidote
MAIDRDKLHQTLFEDIVVAGEERDNPVSPGEILHEEFMEPLGLSGAALAHALNVPANRITALINGQRGLTADTALRLARYFGTTPEFWVRLQSEYDLRQARRTVAEEIKREISPRVA